MNEGRDALSLVDGLLLDGCCDGPADARDDKRPFLGEGVSRWPASSVI